MLNSPHSHEGVPSIVTGHFAQDLSRRPRNTNESRGIALLLNKQGNNADNIIKL